MKIKHGFVSENIPSSHHVPSKEGSRATNIEILEMFLKHNTDRELL
jgi:hypothetical protein